MNNLKLITVNGLDISTQKIGHEYYISLTDIARKKNANEPKDVVKNWMRSRTTIEFLAIWEQLNNPLFKGVEINPLLFEVDEFPEMLTDVQNVNEIKRNMYF